MIRRGIRVLYADDKLTVAALGSRLLISQSGDLEFQAQVALPCGIYSRACAESDLLRRATRREISHVVRLGHRLVVFAFGLVYHVDPISGKVERFIQPIVDTRPLSVCVAGTELLVGQYHRKRSDDGRIAVWRSANGGVTWDIVREFTGVRHIHGVFHDPFENLFWITTGDSDEESGVWRASLDFRQLEKVLGGSQNARVVTLLFSKDKICFGTDSPRLRNHIMRLDRSTLKVEPLQEVPGSVFWGAIVKGTMFLSTVVEPSKINRLRQAEIWRSYDGDRWVLFAVFPKDRLPMKLFRYGQIRFPSGLNDANSLHFVTEGLRGGTTSYLVDSAGPFSPGEKG